MKMINVLSKADVERIVEARIQKALSFRMENVENAVDKLRARLNDLENILEVLR